MPTSSFLETALVALVNARIARRKREATAPPSDHVVLGTCWPLDSFAFGKGEVCSFPSSELRRHVYILGATGSGKTNLLLQLIDQDVSAGKTVVLVDLRGDLVERVLVRLSGLGADPARVCLLDLRDDANVVPFNPLLGAGDVHSRAFHILSVLRHQSESWGVQLEETLRNALVALTEGGYSLVELEAMLLDDAARASILATATDPYVQSFFARYNQLSPERRLTWALPVLNKVTPLLAIPRLRAMLGSRISLDLKSVLDTPGSILLVSLAVDRFHGASHLVGGLLVSALQGAIMARAPIPESQRNPVTLYIDEFETMASDAFLAILAEGRRFGISLVLSHQNLQQVSADLRAGLTSNVHTHLYFQTGAADAADLSREVDGPLPKDEVRSLLLRLHPGETLLVRRGFETKVLRTKLVRDPKRGTAFKPNGFTANGWVVGATAPPTTACYNAPQGPSMPIAAPPAWEVLDGTL